MTTANNSLAAARALGQSIWMDYIQRSLLESGGLQQLIDSDRINGITSNPAIFESAIAKTDEYDKQIAEIVGQTPDTPAPEIFRQLAITDIGLAADILVSEYQQSRGDDGMVSIEVAPELAHDTAATVAEAKSLHRQLDRPNVMIKVPGTEAGVQAFKELTASGISVNVTLLFSLQRYQSIAEAYLQGLEQRVSQGEPIDHIASVASFFVSRVDSKVDTLLDAHSDQQQAQALMGQVAIANARASYGHYQGLVASERFQKLQHKGAMPQRLLWASTGTKNPSYSDVYYVETLLGPDTVNTLPPKTMDAFRDHGTASDQLSGKAAAANATLRQLQDLGIDLKAITDELEKEGIDGFVQAFDRLLQAIDAKSKILKKTA